MIRTLLAEATPQVPWSVTSNWIFGLIGFLGVVFLVLSIIAQCKKIFGRRPPLHEQLESINIEWNRREAKLRAEFEEGDAALAEQIKSISVKVDGQYLNIMEKMEENKGELLTAGERRGKELHERINDVAQLVARVDERTK